MVVQVKEQRPGLELELEVYPHLHQMTLIHLRQMT